MEPLSLKWEFEPILNVQKLNVMLNALSKSLGALGKDIKPIDEAKINESFKKIDDQAKKTGKDLKESFDGGNEGAKKLGQGIEEVKKKLVDTGSLSSKAFNFAMMSQALSSAGGTIKSLSDQFVAMDTGLRNVGTLGVTNWKEFEGLMQGYVNKGADANIVTKALYDSISAGTVKTKNGVADIEGATSFLTASSKLAKAGLVDMSVTTDALTTVLNAYGESSNKAGKYSDILFGAVKLGKTTVAELAPALFNVVPVAKDVGISFDQVAAGLATITKTGVPTSVATTKLRQLIVELTKPTGQLAIMMDKVGISIDTIKADGLQKTMMKLNAEMEKTGMVSSQVFSSIDAAGAYSALQMVDDTGAKVALADLEYMQKEAVGSVEDAYAIASESIASKSKKMFGVIQGAITKAFSFISPSLISVMNVMPQITSTLTAVMALKIIDPVGIFKKLFITSQDNISVISKLGVSVKKMGSQFSTTFASIKNISVKNLSSVSKSLLGMLIPSLTATAGAETVTGVAATGMWAAIGGPISLVIGGIAALGAALYGIHKIMQNMKKETAEEQLIDVESESKSLQSQKEINDKSIKLEEEKQSKLTELRSNLADNQLAFTMDSTNNKTLNEQKQIIADINRMYPGLIEKGDSYAQIQEKITNKQKEQETILIKKQAVSYDMEITEFKIDTKKANLEAQKAGEDITKKMKDATQGWLDKSFEWITGSSSTEQNIIDSMNSYKQAIYKSTTDEDISNQVINFQTAIWNDPAFKDVPEETKLSMVKSIEDMGTKQGEAVKKAMELVKREGGNISDYLPKVEKEDAGLIAESLSTIEKAFNNVFNGIWKVIEPVWYAFKGFIITIGELLKAFMDMVGNAVWETLKSIFNIIIGVIKSMYNIFLDLGNFIKNVFVRAWNGLGTAFGWVGSILSKLGLSSDIVKNAFIEVKKVIDKIWGSIKGIWEGALKIWDKLVAKGKGEVKKAPLKEEVTDDELKKSEKWRKEQDERTKGNKKEGDSAGDLADAYTSMKTRMDDDLSHWSELGIVKQKQLITAYTKEIKQKGAQLNKEQSKELSDMIMTMRKTMDKSTRSSKETTEKDFDEWKKYEEEIAKKKADIIRKTMTDELMVELKTIEDTHNTKVREYKNKIDSYEDQKTKTKNDKEKESLQKSIVALKELTNLEEEEYSIDMEKMYSKLTDKRIKSIEELTKKEIDALKKKKENIELSLSQPTDLITSTTAINSLKEIDKKIIEEETEQKISSIISQQVEYKKLQSELIKYQKLFQDTGKSSYKGAMDKITQDMEYYKERQLETNDEIISITLSSNRQIAETNYKYSLQVKENEIKYIESIEEQKREKELLEAEKTYSEKMKKANGYKAEELQVWIEYQETKSKIEREYMLNNSSVASQTALSFVENLGKSFSEMDFTIDDTSKKETLKKIDDEEKALNQSLKNRTMSYEDYIDKLNDLDKQRTEASINMTQQLTKVMLETISKSLDATIKQFDEKLKNYISNYETYRNSEIEIDKKMAEWSKKIENANAEDGQKLYEEWLALSKSKEDFTIKSEQAIQNAYMQTAAIAGLQFAQMIADGKSASKAMVMSSLAALKALVPVYIAKIFAEEIASKSFAGILTAAGLTALLTAAISTAEAAVNSAKFKRGAVNILGPGTETSDSIPARISKGESVIDAKTTKVNMKELQYIWKNQTNVFQYYKDHEPERIKEAYHSIADAKDLIAFAPVIGVMIQDKAKEKNYNTTMLKMRRELKENNEQMKLMNTKLEELSVINSSIEKGNYLRKEHTTVGIDLQLNESELLTRADRKRLSSLRKL